jgi:2-polyprenyl-3-methyl-5-hydroxy-6-metoxy-1,4-benzoquinol methylase
MILSASEHDVHDAQTGRAPCAAGEYWEQRARQFATQGSGLKAVCSYGMPGFYNRAIDTTQRHVMAPWIKKTGGAKVLDAGCGVGRWSRMMAAQGAHVTGLDLSPTMVTEALRRAVADGVESKYDFMVADLADFTSEVVYDYIFVITVLQHILNPERLEQAVRVLKSQLAPGGKIILLEAAPSRTSRQCDTPVFHARTEAFYLDLFAANGLTATHIRGVDPMPFKTWLLPHYQKLPELVRIPCLAAATYLSLPIDLWFGKYLTAKSWHKLFTLEHKFESGGGKSSSAAD